MKNTNTTNTTVRFLAIGVAAVIATTLLSTIVANMPPEFGGAPGDARNGVQGGTPTEVAIVPSRIEVFGVRSADTAAIGGQPTLSSPRS